MFELVDEILLCIPLEAILSHGKAIKPLPQLSVDLVGEVRGTNLAAYKESAIAFIESINTDLQTDQDFTGAESVIKFCNKAESDLKQSRAEKSASNH